MRWINKITEKRTHNIVPKKKSVLRKILVSGKLLTTVQPLKGYFLLHLCKRLRYLKSRLQHEKIKCQRGYI